MDDVVRAAAGLAQPGDTVLLAPACASMDMFRDYAARGDAFARGACVARCRAMTQREQPTRPRPADRRALAPAPAAGTAGSACSTGR